MKQDVAKELQRHLEVDLRQWLASKGYTGAVLEEIVKHLLGKLFGGLSIEPADVAEGK